MGLLIDGTWHDQWYDTKSSGGRFVRNDAAFRATIAPGGAHPPETGRYHLYVSYACPWAHRVLVVRALKGLEAALPYSFVHPDMLSEGWVFDDDAPDALFGATHLHAIYTRARPTYTGRVTVPVLWDTRAGTIVNNESSEIIRFLDDEMSQFGRDDAPMRRHHLYPAPLRGEIDRVNERVYRTLNNGVYKCGFATTQVAYDEAVGPLFDTLDWLEGLLAERAWLAGDRFTEADVRLFTTLVRFDPVYHGHFKCSRRRLVEYPRLWEHTRAIYQLPGVAPTCRMDHIRRHYHYSHESINPHRVVPVAPDIDYEEPASRGPLVP